MKSISIKASQAASPGIIRRLTALLPKRSIPAALAIAAAGLFAVSGAQATITMTGDVEPGTASAWPSAGTIYVGNTANGNVTVNSGSSLSGTSSTYVYVGYGAGVTGTVNIDGAGSILNASGTGTQTWVGDNGAGIVNITNGGQFKTYNLFTRGGTINIDGSGSTLTEINGLYLGDQYSGSGVVNITNGGTFNTAPGANGVHVGYGATTTLNVNGGGSKWTDNGDAYIGTNCSTMLSIANGGSVAISGAAYIGDGNPGNYSTAVTVDGPGSTLTTTLGLYVGYGNAARMSITNGAEVISGTTSKSAIIGYGPYSGAANNSAVVDGVGSTWRQTNAMYVGYNGGIGTLSISDGGVVSAQTFSIDSVSVLTADVGYGSSLAVGSTGTGAITNNGTIRLVAGAGAGAGAYTPMYYGAMSGSGTVQTLGGVWNSTNHTVTVNAASTAGGAGGATAFISNLASAQRALVTDTALGTSVGAGFQAGSGSLAFTANSIGGAELSGLESKLTAGQYFLSGWTFSTSGYSTGNPVYLSLFAGTSETLSGLEVWDYNGTSWSQFAANDLAYDGAYASFTSTNLNDYAVTGAAPLTGATPTPIPGALLLFGPGLAGLIGMRKRFDGKRA